ncbi:methionine--tRNA ligase [Sediminivirga luteola]|jgi:methionyl-tRNA synthetase|uniref:Methionine--tRNA ligase n=1 Tax=Sediminivirga luteola TaxID=1774748 RepID=A0A8J2XKI5_9MICO|nr:methionine--tRNA ligase [Sediminivirga luteola]MCI2267011.1 methionine--tRNA ligase [Sediminivirga luteola]GGA14797.1 methionine--tRNA ligase [Sediminivirga luteola]
MSAFYITTAIAYPNGTPHIGHAYEYIAADAFARFKRLDGYDVRFLTGTDEHGLKMQQTAQKEGITPRELADRNAAGFKRLQDALGSSYDRFIRTTDADHYEASQELWRRMADAGDIYLGSYSGWYSVRDEAYFAEDETEVDAEGVRRAVSTGAEVTWTEEESYFFRLSAYQDRLLKLYEEHPGFIGPDVRRNEIASFVAQGLKDLSISRATFDWGVPVPGDERHVMYVWVDALTNYLTGIGFPHDEASVAKYWPADVHIIGKDIARFHAVYWPAFLMSAGLDVPTRVHAHGFLFNKGAKMSKSVGNVVDPFELVDEYGLDTLRFFLLREISYGQDGSYSHEAIVTRRNADLANEYGNLAQRSLSMVAKNLGGIVPEPGAYTAEDEELLALADGLVDRMRPEMDRQNVHLALEAAWQVLSRTNRYFSAQEPWVLRKTDPARMGTVLYVTLEVLRIVTLLVQPVIPGSAAAILDQLGVPGDGRDFSALPERLAAGTRLPAPAPVFPKYEA